MAADRRVAASVAAPPRRLLRLVATAALVLVPWTAWLAIALPGSHLDRRWNIAWVGFDIALGAALAGTTLLGWKGSPGAGLAAAAAATMLAVDAWFDCLTARQGAEYLTSLATALFAEVLLAAALAWFAYRSVRT